MSNWTHVAGIVRIDAFGALDTEKANEVFPSFSGNSLTFTTVARSGKMRQIIRRITFLWGRKDR